MSFILHNGDCLDVLRAMDDYSVDSIVTDPPYGLSFMGKKWDYDVPSEAVWAECLRVLKPGGHLLAFAGTRTQHRMAVRIEDAGFEIRDLVMWHYGQGFPKSKNLGNGFGSALKPATEPITMARKPLDGTLEANFAKHGTGALNIDGCRVPTNGEQPKGSGSRGASSTWDRQDKGMFDAGRVYGGNVTPDSGRWPANLIHDGSDEVVGCFPQSSVTGKRSERSKSAVVENTTWGTDNHKSTEYTDSGSAARFFYCAKASKRDRDEGLEGFEQVKVKTKSGGGAPNEGRSASSDGGIRANIHPTVKPTDLMRYLCRLVTPPNGVVLDPFMGSGSTGKAAMLEGFQFVGIEREAEYLDIAKARIEHALSGSVSKPVPQMELI